MRNCAVDASDVVPSQRNGVQQIAGCGDRPCATGHAAIACRAQSAENREDRQRDQKFDQAESGAGRQLTQVCSGETSWHRGITAKGRLRTSPRIADRPRRSPTRLGRNSRGGPNESIAVELFEPRNSDVSEQNPTLFGQAHVAFDAVAHPSATEEAY